MGQLSKSVRTSVTLTPKLAGRVKRLARNDKAGMSKVIVSLIEEGLAAREREKERFLAMAERLTETDDPAEQKTVAGRTGENDVWDVMLT